MPECTAHDHGMFSWIDLATLDTDAAKKFYGGVFGWEFTDQPSGPGMVYSMARKNGKDVAALFTMREEMKTANVPPHWSSYITVDDVDAAAAKAKDLGAEIVMEPFDVMDAGRMCSIKDPVGAMVNFWQAKKNIGAHLVTEPGALAWNELFTPDVDKAKAFYTGMFDWGAETADMGGNAYTSFMQKNRPAAGMLEIQKEWGETPPAWAVYIAVEDCDAAVAKAEELGARVYAQPRDVDTVGRFAMLADPQGGMFAMIQLATRRTI